MVFFPTAFVVIAMIKGLMVGSYMGITWKEKAVQDWKWSQHQYFCASLHLEVLKVIKMTGSKEAAVGRP